MIHHKLYTQSYLMENLLHWHFQLEQQFYLCSDFIIVGPKSNLCDSDYYNFLERRKKTHSASESAFCLPFSFYVANLLLLLLLYNVGSDNRTGLWLSSQCYVNLNYTPFTLHACRIRIGTCRQRDNNRSTADNGWAEEQIFCLLQHWLGLAIIDQGVHDN